MDAGPTQEPARAAPPTVRPPEPPARARPVWPTAIGIGLIVVGGLSALIGAWGIVAAVWMSDFMAAAGQNQGMANAMRESAHVQGITGGAKALIAPALVVAGIGLTRRRAWGARLAVVWSALKMVVGVGVVWATVVLQQKLLASTPTSAGVSPAGMAGVMSAVYWMTGLFTLAWECALPIFLLVWFMLPGVRAHVAGWRARAAPEERAGG
jgi:hypothetical protein